MTGAFVFAYFVLPFIVGGIGFPVAYPHIRADNADRRADLKSSDLSTA